MSPEPCVQALVAFGFTALEAEVYVFLVQESPATGYRVAQGIGKPVANTYKAIASLQAKGAILVEEGASRRCRAVPADELLQRLERRFQESRQRAALALSTLKASPDDDRVYHLRTWEQVAERSRQMLARCEQVAVLDLFPGPLEELRPAITQAAARGVRVLVKAYAPAQIERAEVVVNPRGYRVLKRWAGQWLNLVTDGRESLLAFLTRDGKGVHQALWSGSAYLSWVYHSAVGGETILTAVEQSLGKGATGAELRELIRSHHDLFRPALPGYQELRRRFGDAGPATAPTAPNEIGEGR
jgi:sugar-specific transcriptional regulator TrmB